MKKLLIVTMLMMSNQGYSQKVIADAKATPHMQDGEITGYQLTKIRTDSIFAKIGLKNLDIITAIDGAPLGAPDQAIRLLNNIRNQSETTLSFKREGQVKEIVFTNDMIPKL